MHRRPPGQAANNQSNQQMARPSRFRNGSATTNDHGIIVRLSLLKNLSIIGNRSSSITSLEEGGFVPTTKVNFLPSRLPRSNRIEELHPRTSIAQQSILRRLHILLQIPIMTHSSNDDIMLKSHDDVAVLRRSCQQGSSSLLMKKSRRRDMHLLFAMIAIILTSMLASVVEGANNNHSGNNGGSGGTGGSGSGNNHHNSMNGGGGNSGQGGGDAADEEPESFEAPVNITLLPNSKQISYWMYSMKTPGHIDMRHLLFHSTDDKNNIADGTKNSAVDVVVFRVANYMPFCGTTPEEIKACGGGLGAPVWRSCNLETDFDENGDAFPNNPDGCQMPYDEKDYWHRLGFGGYRDATADDDDDEAGDDAGSNSTSTNATDTSPSGKVLEWCCTDAAIQAGLCPQEHHGRLLVNETTFQGNHRYIPISKLTAISTGLRDAKILQPFNNGTYVVAMANCNRHGRPMEVVGKWSWDPLPPNNTATGNDDDAADDAAGSNNSTTPTNPESEGTSNTTSTPASSSNETDVPPPTFAPHPSHSAPTSGSGISPSAAPHTNFGPTQGGGSSPNPSPTGGSTSGSGGGSPPTGGSGNRPPSFGAPNNGSGNGAAASQLPSSDTAKFGVAVIGALLCIAFVSYMIMRSRRHKHHLVDGSDMQFNDLELVESRKQQHYTDYGENGYMPNFS